MEFIVKQGNNTLNLNNRNPLRSVTKAEHRQSLLSEDVINISIESKTPLSFNIGNTIEYEARKYTLNSAPKVKREQGIYTYDLIFEGVQYLLRDKIYFNRDAQGYQTGADFPLTGEIEMFLTTLINNINTIGQTWILGFYPQNTETKTLTFNNENCLAVLQRICQEYDTEFEIVEDLRANTCTLNIKKIGTTLNQTFEYGKGNGLYSLTRENVNNDVITRLYVYGSTENLKSGYRGYSQRLRLPISHGADYIQDDAKVALFGLKEGVKNFDDIKPTFKGVVSKVTDLPNGSQEIVVSNMDFDLNEKDSNGTRYLLNDTPAKLHVNKGNLAGYKFELLKNGGYNHATKTFKVKQFTDERGQMFPEVGTVFTFAVGDEFTLLDIAMPPQYITNAENKLLVEGQKEYEKLSVNNLKYTLDLDPQFLQKMGNAGSVVFSIGDYIRVVDTQLNVDKTSRIVDITRDLLDEFNYKLSIADTYEVSFVASMVAEIKDTKKVIKTQKEINRQNYLNGYRQNKELQDSIFDTDGYFDPVNIKPGSIQTNMIAVGAKSQQFALENVTLNPNVLGSPARVSITGGKLVHFSLEDNIREWYLPPYNRTDLLNQLYYVYAKCSRGGSNAMWHITTEKIKFDSRDDYYYFLCYILYTPNNGKREAEAMYGNVVMHGGQISAGRIKSTNGKTYFDLDSGEINGKITFTSDSPALQQVVDAVQVGGRNLALNSKQPLWSGNNTGFGTSLKMNDETGEFVRITPDSNKIVSVYGFKNPNFENGKFSRSMAFRHSHNASIWIWGQEVVPNQWVRLKQEAFSTYNEWNGFDSNIAGVPIDVKEFMLVKGNKIADGWTPAPEDIQASIDYAKAKAQEALGLTQNQQTNINNLISKTDFLTNTAVQGNAVATGSVIVGNGYGANAGLTGLGGNTDMFLWGGADYNNRGNAPISIHRDGFLRVRNGAGQVIFEIGQKNGKAVFNIYNDNGTKTAEIGQSGIQFIGYVSDSFSEEKLWRLNIQNGTPDNLRRCVTSALRKIRLEGHPTSIEEHQNGTFGVFSPENTTAYLYNAGNNFETQANKQYENIFFATQNKLGNKIQDGYYIMKYHTIFNIEGGRNMWQSDGLCPVSMDIIYISDGKVLSLQSCYLFEGL